MIHGHGDDGHLYPGKLLHNFSSNVYYKGCPPQLLAHIAAKAQAVQSYPSPMAAELNEAAAQRYQLSPNHFLFTNGATEAFYLITHLFAGQTAAIVAPTFAEYADACQIHGVQYQSVTQATLHPANYKLVFICNPNNPDGHIVPTDVLVQLVKANPATTFVVDEAYIEFTNSITSLAPWVGRLPNLIVVRSLTKTFAIPGLRLGYVMAAPDTVERLLSKKMPWSVNAFAIEAGLQLFAHYDQWQFDITQLLAETQTFIQGLAAIDWLAVQPTHASYFLARLHRGTAAELKSYLATQHGILIRDATNFKGLHGQHIRLATQSAAANAQLIKALKDWK